MDRSTLGRLLRPPEVRGLIVCKPSLKDRRQKLISLTDDGSTLLRSARPLWAKAESRFEDIFGHMDAIGMRALMRRVTTVRFKTA
jgi:DNA-binding MarR family transcriptional regulator